MKQADEMTADELDGMQLQAADALYAYFAHGMENKTGWFKEALYAFFKSEICPPVWYDDEGKL